MCTKCAHDGKKVCGSDGKTYNDFCKLQKVACESNTTLNMARKGPCEGKFLLLYFVSLHVGPFGGRGAAKKPRNVIMTKSENMVSPEWFVGTSVPPVLVVQATFLSNFCPQQVRCSFTI